MKTLQSATLLAATVSTGLIAGLFFAYVTSVMPALRRSSDHTFVESMWHINRVIQNPVFLLLFAGSIPLIGLALFLALRDGGRTALPWIVAGLVIYVIAFFITMSVNVPLNNELDQAGVSDQAGALAAVREHFEDKWVAWNIIRTVVHVVAFGCLAWGLVVYGGDRDKADAADKPSVTHRTYSPTAF